MEHLTTETLARLVDAPPGADERNHLNRCRRCRDELDALQAQTLGLSHLPDIRPPRGDWESLEVRLRREGLIHADGAEHGRRRRGRAHAPWFQMAAGLVLLLTGGGLGAAWMAATSNDGGARSASPRPSAAGVPASTGARSLDAVQAALGLPPAGRRLSLDEAEELVRVTESWYLSALLRYREEMTNDEGGVDPDHWGDPVTRYAALETLFAAGQAVIREAPADPFLNGFLLNVRAERDATLRGIRTAALDPEVWY